ncbi:prepilin peptidase [Actinoplanes sp. NEAU-A11]|uniref:Prepilin peptidase n=2 Tax=Actinoplanes aureus TaxID=2792083 RepID=A0A931FUU9_9ACTN|nr:prepilin peptidase [Actinoplanes aureus]
MAGVFGGAAAAFLPRIAHRFAYPEPVCRDCGRDFPSGVSGWVHAGAACGCGGWIGPVLASAAVAALLAGLLGPVLSLPALLLAAVLGVLLAVIDLRCLRLPDPLVGGLAVIAGVPLALIEPARIGTAVAAGVLVGTGYLLVALLPGGGLGLGDVKLGAVLGLVLGFGGWPAVAVGFAAAHLINGVVAGWLLARGRAHGGRALPFGPALLVGALISMTFIGYA